MLRHKRRIQGGQTAIAKAKAMSSLDLLSAVRAWWGLQDVGIWQFSDSKSNKVVSYSPSSSVALDCFGSTPSVCPTKPKCRPVRGSCLPADQKGSWGPSAAERNSMVC